MEKKDQRITVTPVSLQDYDMVKILSHLDGATYSAIGARAINEWLKENFTKEVERHRKINEIVKDYNNENASAPTTLAEPDLSFKDDEEIDHPLWSGLKKNGGLEDV